MVTEAQKPVSHGRNNLRLATIPFWVSFIYDSSQESMLRVSLQPSITSSHDRQVDSTSPLMAPLRTLFTLAVLLPVILVIHYAAPFFFRFDPKVLQETSQAAIKQHGSNVKPLLQQLAADLSVKYPGIVDAYDDSKWVFNVAGGATVCSRDPTFDRDVAKDNTRHHARSKADEVYRAR